MRPALLALLLLAGCQTVAAPPPTQPAAAEPAAQDMACMPRQEMIAILGHDYGEAPVGIGVERRGVMVEVYVGPDHTFSIVATNPQGLSCLIFAGEGWEAAPPSVKESGT